MTRWYEGCGPKERVKPASGIFLLQPCQILHRMPYHNHQRRLLNKHGGSCLKRMGIWCGWGTGLSSIWRTVLSPLWSAGQWAKGTQRTSRLDPSILLAGAIRISGWREGLTVDLASGVWASLCYSSRMSFHSTWSSSFCWSDLDTYLDPKSHSHPDRIRLNKGVDMLDLE